MSARAGIAVALALAAGLSGCGYRLAGGASDPLGPFTIEGGAARAPAADVMAAAEDGARAELVRQGAHVGARATPHQRAIVVEILRVDESSDAIAAASSPNGAAPLARSLRVVVTGRAFVRDPSGGAARDTGDVRAAEVIARAADAPHAMLARDEAARRAGRRLGEILVRRVLGYPEPSDL